MGLSRFECSMSGERIEIQQAAYINGDGDLIVLDALGDAPDGCTPATDEQVEAHRNPPKTADQLRSEWKALRAAQVEAIKVTTLAGNTFDGDEISQGRMARAILALNAASPETTVNWVLADNTVIATGSPELTEALTLAGAAQAAIWVAA